ncbi:hypothetical protein EMGBS15_00470 [Filimonas sp.]|nr:hypothetical protein EMGBS15_00470 [Filimonas sp.]
MTNEVTPAELEPATATVIADTARKIYNVLNCKGICRIDFIWKKKHGNCFSLRSIPFPVKVKTASYRNKYVPQV